MAEWLKAHAWKACVRETVPWVRIPLSPPSMFVLVRRHTETQQKSVLIRIRCLLLCTRVRDCQRTVRGFSREFGGRFDRRNTWLGSSNPWTSLGRSRPGNTPMAMVSISWWLARRRNWSYRYWIGGKERWHGLGSLNDVSLKEARIQRDTARQEVRAGVDIVQAKRSMRIYRQQFLLTGSRYFLCNRGLRNSYRETND